MNFNLTLSPKSRVGKVLRVTYKTIPKEVFPFGLTAAEVVWVEMLSPLPP